MSRIEWNNGRSSHRYQLLPERRVDTANVVEVDVSELCLVTLVNDSDVLDLVDAAILAVDATYINNR